MKGPPLHGRARLPSGHRRGPHDVQGARSEDRRQGRGEHSALRRRGPGQQPHQLPGLHLRRSRCAATEAPGAFHGEGVGLPAQDLRSADAQHEAHPRGPEAGRGRVCARPRLAALRSGHRGVPRSDDLAVVHAEELQVGRRAPGPGGRCAADPHGAVGYPASVDEGPPEELQASSHPDHDPGRRADGGPARPVRRCDHAAAARARAGASRSGAARVPRTSQGSGRHLVDARAPRRHRAHRGRGEGRRAR